MNTEKTKNSTAQLDSLIGFSVPSRPLAFLCVHRVSVVFLALFTAWTQREVAVVGRVCPRRARGAFVRFGGALGTAAPYRRRRLLPLIESACRGRREETLTCFFSRARLSRKRLEPPYVVSYKGIGRLVIAPRFIQP